ncbi:MAG: helix-turn-helix transcriptional regulator, partial [Kiritimatiellae bacterium]|nr:helix-turn-helix transcriptional regulator [Kiritimatiellia bacterium]
HVVEAMEIIRREACAGLTPARLAAMVPGSRKHFERRFREAMGRSVLDEIMHVRLQAVMDLLSHPKPPIGAIADFCGFGSQVELRIVFRDRTGMSLRQWRKNHLG